MIWLVISVIYIWLYSIGIFIAAIGPPLIFAEITTSKGNQISMTAIGKGVVLYAQEGSKKLNVNYNYFLYSLFLNIILVLPSIVVGTFALRRKLWARNGLIVLLTLYLICPIIIARVTSEYNLDILNINRLPFVAIIFLLTRKTIEKIFTEQQNQPAAE